MRAAILLAVALLIGTSCTREPSPTGFESPAATIDSLFRAYGVEDMSQTEARRRLQARERFKLLDPALFRSCFSDWQGEHDQALGGFVFGQLVAAKDELEIETDEGTARVRFSSAADDFHPIVLVERERAWKIDLRQSIAPRIRQSLYEVYRRARRAERKAR